MNGINDLVIKISIDELAQELAKWPVEDIVELIQSTSDATQDWELVKQLTGWSVQQYLMMQTEDDNRCHRSKDFPQLWSHSSPHIGCILR